MRHLRAIGTVAYMGGVMAVPEPFCWSWGAMREYTSQALCQDDEFIHFDRTNKSEHSFARNEIASRFLGDWLLMFDTDLTFEPDTAARLVRYALLNDLDVVTGLYVYKSGMIKLPVLHMWSEEKGRHEIVGDWDEHVDLFEVHSGGAGCLLVRRRVFERLAELKDPPFGIIPPYSEDHSFFRRCRQLGIKIFCAWRVQCGHLRYEAEHLNPADRIRENYQLTPHCVQGITEGATAQI